MGYGLREDLIRDVKEYILGASNVPFVPFTDGDNEKHLPKYESQTTRLGHETSGCTAYGGLSQLESHSKMRYGTEPNYSERFTYNLVPIDPGKGVDPQRTYECIRHEGVIDEQLLPMTDSIAEYADRSAVTGSFRARGQHWLATHDFRHEWLWSPRKPRPQNYIELLKEALTTGTLGVSVDAWREAAGEYVSNGVTNNHWCLLYKIDSDGHPWVFDTYDHSKKKLSKDHNIRLAKRIWLQKRTRPAMRMDIKTLTKIVLRLLSMKSTLFDVATQNLGVDVTPQDTVPDDVACAEVLTTLMKKVYPETPIIPGTATLYEWLLKQPSWKQTNDPQPGDIAICPTGYGKGPGHCWVVMENCVYASNNSLGIHKGKFTQNYTRETIQAKYPSFTLHHFTRV